MCCNLVVTIQYVCASADMKPKTAYIQLAVYILIKVILKGQYGIIKAI